jgi:membrane protein YdbS with pleckstrin-like domain
MKPWSHPQERRSRIFWSIQIALGVIAMILAPILLLREPTRDHVLIAAAVVVLGAIGVVLGIKVLRNLSNEYKSEPEGEDRINAPG